MTCSFRIKLLDFVSFACGDIALILAGIAYEIQSFRQHFSTKVVEIRLGG